VTGAVGVLASEGSGEGVLVGDMAMDCWVQVVRILVRESMRHEDSELVRGVRV